MPDKLKITARSALKLKIKELIRSGNFKPDLAAVRKRVKSNDTGNSKEKDG